MSEYIERCKKCSHFQVCANVMKNQLFIREKMLLEENPECEQFVPVEDVVEVKHGKWIRDSLTGHISCSNCKMTAPGDCELEDFYESDFCPNCGAKMDGKENGK